MGQYHSGGDCVVHQRLPHGVTEATKAGFADVTKHCLKSGPGQFWWPGLVTVTARNIKLVVAASHAKVVLGTLPLAVESGALTACRCSGQNTQKNTGKCNLFLEQLIFL